MPPTTDANDFKAAATENSYPDHANQGASNGVLEPLTSSYKTSKNIDDVTAPTAEDDVRIGTANREKYRFIKTCLLCLAYVTQGMSITIFGPTLSHMEKLFDTSMPIISLTFFFIGSGYLLGSVLCGVLFDRFNSQLLWTVALLLLSTSTGVCSWVQVYYVFFIVMALQGIALGFMDAAGPPYCLVLWGKHKYKEPVLQALHCFWTLGGAISPLIIRLFLVPLPPPKSVCQLMNSTSLTPITIDQSPSPSIAAYPSVDNISFTADEEMSVNGTEPMHYDVGFVRYGYVTVGFIGLLSAILFFVVLLLDGQPLRKEDKAASEIASKGEEDCNGTTENSCEQKDTVKYGKLMILAQMFLLIFFFSCFLNMFHQLLSTFVYKGLCWSSGKAALAATSFWLGMLAGRILSVPLSVCLRPTSMLNINLVLMTAAMVTIVVSSLLRLHESSIWAAIGIAGLGMSTVFPCCILWTSGLTTFDGKAGATFQIAASLGNILCSSFAAYLMASIGHMILVYLLLGANLLVILFAVCMHISTRLSGRRGRGKFQVVQQTDVDNVD